MKGFSDKCLLLFPKPEVYEYKTDTYYSHFNKAVNNIIDYLKSIDVSVDCFTTDEVALHINPPITYWIQTLCGPDDFFMRTHNEAMSDLKFKKNVIEPTDLYKEVIDKIPLQRGLTENQRFDLIVKRERYVAKEIIDSYKLVITFHQASNQAYKVVTKAGDSKIRIFVNNGTFQCSCFLSGEEVDPNDLLNFQGANRPVHTWRDFK